MFQEFLVNNHAKWNFLQVSEESPSPSLRDHVIRRFVKNGGIRCRARYEKVFSGYDMPAVFWNTLQIQIPVGFLILTPGTRTGPSGFHHGKGKAHKEPQFPLKLLTFRGS